jgi:hypothetical protein
LLLPLLLGARVFNAALAIMPMLLNNDPLELPPPVVCAKTIMFDKQITRNKESDNRDLRILFNIFDLRFFVLIKDKPRRIE